MSYCRFSSDNWKSDVYIYYGKEGYTVHVAQYRYTGEIPSLPDILETPTEEYHKAYLAQMEAVNSSPKEKIKSELAGATLTFEDPEALIQALRNMQRGEGIHVPEYVFEAIRQDIAWNRNANETKCGAGCDKV